MQGKTNCIEKRCKTAFAIENCSIEIYETVEQDERLFSTEGFAYLSYIC